MHVQTVLHDECLAANHPLADKEEALRYLARLAAASPALAGIAEEEILAGLRDRENLGSTGFGDGVAIPHCRLPQVKEFVAGLVTVPEGVDFGAMDGAPVRVIVFIVAPDDASTQHVQLLSRISQGLMAPGVFAGLISAREPAALRDILLRSTEPAEENDSAGSEPNTIFHILVRGEELFTDVLTVVNGVEHTRLAVLEYDSGSQYLRRVPLFAAFWTDAKEKRGRMLVAVVRKRLVNETIRRLERQVGRLDRATDLLVMVQDLFFCVGGLTA
jgi:nitrogen PTS system EIIA component